MTPEQKAFYECGKSVESVRETIQKIRQYAIHEFGEPYYLLMPSEKRILRMATDLAGKIYTVRQKRAACRAFMVPNDCSKCIHFPNKYPGWKCVGCKWDISYKNVKSRWEPRKEEENETDA